jgi:hypothetical protein
MTSPDFILKGKAFRYMPFESRSLRIFNVAEYDLTLNRDGKVSLNQQQLFRQTRNQQTYWWGGIGLLLIFLLVIFVPEIYPEVGNAPLSVQILFGVFPVWMLFIVVYIWYKYALEIEDPELAIVVGIPFVATAITSWREGGTRGYSFNVKHKTWFVSSDKHRMLKNLLEGSDRVGQYYAVYYTTRTNSLLSIEPVEMIEDYSDNYENGN